MSFPNPDQVDFVPKYNQTLHTALPQSKIADQSPEKKILAWCESMVCRNVQIVILVVG